MPQWVCTELSALWGIGNLVFRAWFEDQNHGDDDDGRDDDDGVGWARTHTLLSGFIYHMGDGILFQMIRNGCGKAIIISKYAIDFIADFNLPRWGLEFVERRTYTRTLEHCSYILEAYCMHSLVLPLSAFFHRNSSNSQFISSHSTQLTQRSIQEQSFKKSFNVFFVCYKLIVCWTLVAIKMMRKAQLPFNSKICFIKCICICGVLWISSNEAKYLFVYACTNIVLPSSSLSSSTI